MMTADWPGDKHILKKAYLEKKAKKMLPLNTKAIDADTLKSIPDVEKAESISHNFRFDLQDQFKHMECYCMCLALSDENSYLIADYLENVDLSVFKYFTQFKDIRDAAVVRFDYKNEMIGTQNFKLKLLCILAVTHNAVNVESSIGYRVVMERV